MGARARKTEGTRVACVDLRALPLQILLHDRPEWRRYPAAVVAEDRPDSPLILVSPLAERARLRPGMRYGVARDLVPSLRAAPVSDERVKKTVDELTVALATFSPRVEPDVERPGTFYVDPNGLHRIYGGFRSWADAVYQYLRGRRYESAVVVGFERFEAFAVARSHTGIEVIGSRSEGRTKVAEVRLASLGVSPDLLRNLALLDVHTLGDLLTLPGDALHARYGAEASRLHALAGGPQMPLQPRRFEEPVRVEAEIDPPDADHARLLFALKGALHTLITQVTARCETLSALSIELRLETPPRTRSKVHRERIEPAAPTRDALSLLDLVRLRLSDLALEAPVEAIAVQAETAPPSGEQLALFRFEQKRDLRAGDRALARVRAAFGPRSVTKARLRDAHLPEAGFSWDAMEKMPNVTAKKDAGVSTPPLVRRVLPRPKPLPSRQGEPYVGDGDRALLRLYGPYRVSGGWWVRTVERDYYYGETGRGDLLWLYYDRPRKRWFLQGAVD